MNSNILDIQPVRDISFYLDSSIFRLTKFNSYHLSNILIFSFSTALLASIIYDITKNLILSLAIGVFTIANPLFVNPVIWISCRKHLLACLYFLAFIKIYLKNINNLNHIPTLLKLYFFYCLSILSQPITLFLPLALITKKNISDNKTRIFLFFSLLTFVIFTLISIRHYHNYAESNILVNVGGAYDYEHFGKASLALGRYFFNMIYPFKTFFYYSESSYFNLIGLVFLVVYLYLGYLYKNNPKVFFLQKTVFLFLSTVTIYRIGNFVSDTYILSSYFAFIISLVVLLSESKYNYYFKYINIILVTCALCFFIKSYQDISRWKNFSNVLKYNYENEFNDTVATMYISNLFSNGEITKGIVLLNHFYDINHKMLLSPRQMWKIVGISIYLTDNFYPETKENIFHKFSYFSDPNIQFFRALNKVDLKKFNDAYRILFRGLKLLKSFIPGNEVYLGRFMALCQELQKVDCQHIIMEEIKKIPKFSYDFYLEEIENGKKQIEIIKSKKLPNNQQNHLKKILTD